jgi:predicted metal-binding transcription factor (methanogenesis marker protein 9)
MPELSLINFDTLVKRLNFNLESAKSSLEAGEPKSAEEIEALEKYINQFKETIRKLEIAREVAQKTILTVEDVYRLMSITCYGNIGYCCGLTKDCLWRDSCRQALQIDDDTYVTIKEMMIWQVLRETRRSTDRE